MKPILFFLFLLLAINVNAQKIRFTDSTNQWTTLSINGDGCSFLNSFSYGNDTIVHGTPYRLMSGSGSDYFGYDGMCFCGLAEFAEQFKFLIREDTILKKVYYMNISSFTADTIEHILYNYNLNIGDSINYTGYTDTVASIDSTLINGVYHKIFNFQNKIHGFWRSYTVLEGVGCTNDPVFPTYFGGCFEYNESLVCFYENGIRPVAHAPINSCSVYTACAPFNYGAFDNTTGCGSLLSSNNISQQKPSITITPNPATDYINITNDKGFGLNASVSIYNVTGKCIYHTLTEENNTMVNVKTTSWIDGLYMVVIQNNTGIMKEKKIVIRQ